MQSTSAPAKFLVPFATNDTAKVEIPVTTVDATRASQSLGFPPLTMQPPEVGGVPPQGEDFNGAMNQVARAAWWVMLGSLFVYDATFATNVNIGGYPKGSQLLRADLAGLWLNGTENNTTNPDDNTGAGAGWLPGYTYGSASIAVSTATTVYPVVAAHKLLYLTGTLTANSVVNLPAWVYDWQIIDNTVRAGFTLTVKTATGTGIVIASGAQRLQGDGTNIIQQSESIPNATSPTQALNKGQADSLYAPASAAGAAIQGAYSNLRVSATGLSANVSVTCAELVLENGSNVYKTVRNLSLTINAAGTPGTPNAPSTAVTINTFYAIWVWDNGATQCGTLDLSNSAPTPPTGGFTFKALVGHVRIDGSANKFPWAFTQVNDTSQLQIGPTLNLVALPVVAAGVQGTPGTTLVSVATASFFPAGVAAYNLLLYTTAGTAQVAPNATANPSANSGILSGPPAGGNAQLQFLVTPESANIYYAATSPNAELYAAGWRY